MGQMPATSPAPDARERDVTDPVADQRHALLHQERPDHGREHTDRDARDERSLHERRARTDTAARRWARASVQPLEPEREVLAVDAQADALIGEPRRRPVEQDRSLQHDDPVEVAARPRRARARRGARRPRGRASGGRANRGSGAGTRRRSPAMGSSSTSSSGSLANARAMNARCCCPPDSSLTGRSANSARPTDSSACRAASRSSLRSGRHHPRRASLPVATISSTVAGTSDPRTGRCGTYPSRHRSLTSRGGAPNSRTSPADGVERPEQHLQERRLAGAVRTDERHELPRNDAEVDVLQDRRAPVRERDPGRLEQREPRSGRAPRDVQEQPSATRNVERFSRICEP